MWLRAPTPTPAVLLRFRASLRRRPRLLRGPGQGRKLARPPAGPAPLGRAGCSLELARHLRAESGSRVSRPVTLSGSPTPAPPAQSVVLSPESPCLRPPSQLFPSLVCLGSPVAQSTALPEIQKEVLCFPGGSSLMLPLFSGTKQTFSGEGAGADSFPSPQHPAPLQVQNARSRAPAAWGWGEGPLPPGSTTKAAPPAPQPPLASARSQREGDMVFG